MTRHDDNPLPGLGPRQNPNGLPASLADESMLAPEPLPVEIEAPLRDLDGRIRREIAEPALRGGVPPGLEDRVFEASVSLLPCRVEPARREQRARPVVARIGFIRPTWGRMAMAASLGLAFVVVAFFIGRPTGMLDGTATVTEVALASDLSWLGSEAFKEERQVAYLLDTGDLRSFSELTMELESAIDELGM